MSRATEADIRTVIETDADISLVPFISAAGSLVDYVSAQDTGSVLSAAQLRDVETWLAAHFYAIRDQQYQAKSTDGASATFQGTTGRALDSTFWGQQAMLLDVTGCLSGLNQDAQRGKIKATATWLGLPPSSQTSYEDRD